MVHQTRMLGNQGEQAVAVFLEKKGYIIVASNIRWLGGEIDIVASRENLLVFVEVKTRKHESKFPLSTVVTVAKQRKIIKTALRFIAQHGIQNIVIRFDVALVTLQSQQKPQITYIPHAFTAPESDY